MSVAEKVILNNWELNNKQHSCTDDNFMSRTREEKGFILINKEGTTVHIFAILPHFRITVFISKLVRLHGYMACFYFKIDTCLVIYGSLCESVVISSSSDKERS